MTEMPKDIVDAARWTRWKDQRPPNQRGTYRYRVTAEILGAVVTPEWSEEMVLCGMGYAESEWWPLKSCRWDGYRRYITHEGLEWSPVLPGDPEGVVWGGLNLLPCPFTGLPAHIEPVGRYIGAPLWHSEAVYISSAGVPKRRWTNIPKMVAAWNSRDLAERQRNEERIKALEDEMADWSRRDVLSLHVGEVTAQEFRTVVAVLKYFRGRARAIFAKQTGEARDA